MASTTFMFSISKIGKMVKSKMKEEVKEERNKREINIFCFLKINGQEGLLGGTVA